MLLIISFSGFQSFGDKINVPLCGSDARRRLLLERVQDVHGFVKSNRVHRPKRVSVVRLHDLQHARTEALPRLAVGEVPPKLRDAEGVPMSSLTAAGKLRKSRLEDPTQCSGFSSAARTRRTYTIIPVLGYSGKAFRWQVLLQSPFRICDAEILRGPRSRAIMLGLVASEAPALLQLDATAEETMSPIARRPMPSSLPAA